MQCPLVTGAMVDMLITQITLDLGGAGLTMYHGHGTKGKRLSL